MLALIALMLLLFLLATARSWPPERPSGQVPTPQQRVWQEFEYGMFCHFGPNTFHDVEWGDGTAAPDSFNPTEFDARQWVEAARDAGMKYFVATAKHHDGFCLWPTEQTDYSVRSSSWRGGKGDVIRDVADACRDLGLALGIYLSPWDRHEPCYADNEAYDGFYVAQLTELLTNYGEVALLWCDGAGGEGHVYNWEAYYRHLNSLQPDCLQAIAGVSDVRWVGNEDGYAPDPLWNVVEVGGRDYWWPAECDARVRKNWFWHPGDADTIKSVDDLVAMYHASVGRGANLLLNVGPDDRGLLPEQDVQRLRELRAALEGIYAQDLLSGNTPAAGGAAPGHGPECALDGNPETHWLAVGEDEPRLEVQFPAPVTFDRLVLQEAIQLGQRIRTYTVEVQDGDGWKRVHEGTSVGHKKMDVLQAPVTGRAVRFTFRAEGGPPALRSIAAYRTPA